MARRHKAPPACTGCGALLTFARVGQIRIALDKDPVDQGGTVAAYTPATGGIMTGRWLVKADRPDSHEKAYAKHRCPPKPEPQPTLFDTITN